ncbi:MAG: HTTM domain-containing protein [Pirellulaceae bacterium]
MMNVAKQLTKDVRGRNVEFASTVNPPQSATVDFRPAALLAAWDRFWFAPSMPHTLAAMRILTGLMLFYTHFVLALDLQAFLGQNAWVNTSTALLLNTDVSGARWAFSYLYYIQSPAILWTAHVAALVALAMFTAGLFTRVTSVLSFIITLSYCHRLSGALFGLDQINLFLVMYLMLAPCGSLWSLDRWIASRRGIAPPLAASSGVTVATRLLQLHLCIMYLFGGIDKARGESWWDGSAVWFAIANLEYQSLDLTWLVHQPWLVALLTHVTLFWEVFYPVLIWPRLTRPIFLAMAVAVHGGIALALGMTTFGLAMIIANLVFVTPELTARLVSGVFRALRLPK